MKPRLNSPTIQLLIKLGKIQAEYPAHLLAARRAAFVKQVTHALARSASEQTTSRACTRGLPR